eukprot:357104-Chlamydomonas_euryale.AAC.3
MPEAGGRGTFTCMDVQREGPAEAEADMPRPESLSSMFCARMTLPRFHKGKREDRHLMHTA